MENTLHESPVNQHLGIHIQRAQEHGFTNLEQSGDRAWMHRLVLRGIARQRHEDRGQDRPALNETRAWNEAWQLDQAQERELREEFRLVARRVAVMENFETYVRECRAGNVQSGLRDYQIEPFEATQAFVSSATKDILTSDEPVLQSLTKGGYLEEPPSFGKTYFMAEIAKAIGAGSVPNEHDNYPIRVLILTPRRKLVRQTIGKPTTTTKVERGFAAAAPDLHVTPYYSGKRDLSGDVVVMTYQSFISAVNNGTLDEHHFDLILCDEGHRIIATKTQEAIKQYRAGRLTIALTGSPNYDEGKKLEHVLPHRIEGSDPLTGIQQGYINGFQYWAYRTGAEIKVTNNTHAEFTDAEVHSLIGHEERNRLILSIMKRDIESGRRGIVRCVRGRDCLHPKIIASLASGVQIKDPITGEMRPMRVIPLDYHQDDILDDIIDQLSDPDGPDALAYVGILNEGVDSAAIRFIVDAAPTASQVVGKQVAGRSYRIDPQGRLTMLSQLFDDLVGRKTRYTFLHAVGITEFEQGLVVAPAQVDATNHPWNGGPVRPQELPAELRGALIEDLSAYCAEQLELRPVYGEVEPDAISLVDLADRGKAYVSTLGKATVRNILQKADFEDPVYAKPPQGWPGHYYKAGAWEVLERELQKIKLPPEGWRNRNEIVLELGSNTYRFDQQIRRRHITSEPYNNPDNLVETPYYSPEAFAQLKNLEDKRIPAQPDDIEVLKLAREVGATPAVLERFLQQRSIKWQEKIAASDYSARFISGQHAAEVREYFGIVEGSLTISEIGHLLGVARTRVVTWLQTNGHLAEVKRKDHYAANAPRLSNYGRRFTPDVIAEAIESLSPDQADPDWVTLRAYAKSRGRPYTDAKRLIEAYDIPVRRVRDAQTRSTAPVLYLDAAGRVKFDEVAPPITAATPGERTMNQLKTMTGFSDFKIRSTLTAAELTTAQPKIGTEADNGGRRTPHFPATTVQALLNRLGLPVPAEIAREAEIQLTNAKAVKATPRPPRTNAKRRTEVAAVRVPSQQNAQGEPAVDLKKNDWPALGTFLKEIRCDTKSFWVLLRRSGMANPNIFNRRDGARDVQLDPNAVGVVSRMASDIAVAPRNWYTASEIARHCNTGEQQVLEFIRVLTPQDQEVKLFRTNDEHTTISVHYSAQIAASAKQRFAAVKKMV